MHRFDFFAHGWAARALTVLLACGLALTATSALATLPDTDMEWQADDRYWNFRVLLDDREIGFHEFRVLNDGTEQRVEIERALADRHQALRHLPSLAKARLVPHWEF